VEGEVRGSSSPVLKTTGDPKVLDGLRNRGIIRLDDPRLAEVKAAGGPEMEIDRKTLDELRRAGITSLDDPRLTYLRGQAWSGTREVDQRTIDELRRLGITKLDDPRVRELTENERPDIDAGTINELLKSGIVSLDDAYSRNEKPDRVRKNGD
jgi:hypothetical protein